MRPRFRVAITDVPLRSRKKAAYGTKATTIQELWANVWMGRNERT